MRILQHQRVVLDNPRKGIYIKGWQDGTGKVIAAYLIVRMNGAANQQIVQATPLCVAKCIIRSEMRPEGLISKQPRTSPWVIKQHGNNALKGQKRYSIMAQTTLRMVSNS